MSTRGRPGKAEIGTPIICWKCGTEHAKRMHRNFCYSCEKLHNLGNYYDRVEKKKPKPGKAKQRPKDEQQINNKFLQMRWGS